MPAQLTAYVTTQGSRIAGKPCISVWVYIPEPYLERRLLTLDVDVSGPDMLDDRERLPDFQAAEQCLRLAGYYPASSWQRVGGQWTMELTMTPHPGEKYGDAWFYAAREETW